VASRNPRSRPRGDGRACLLVGAAAAAEPLLASLRAEGFEPVVARDDADAQARLEADGPALVLVATGLGLAALGRTAAAAAQTFGSPPVVAVGATASVQDAIDAMQAGAADYLSPPHDAASTAARLARVLARSRERPAGGAPHAGFIGLVGGSPAMRKVYATIERIGRYKTNVLVLGESGTGKELIARALHDRSPRRNHLFVPVNCATLGREILENELFGHERGAFTGADERKRGLFELADGGTFFLDEIAEMDVSTQAKLLRVLERNEFRRVGGTAKVKVDLNVIAATNRDLEASIAAGRFREDLYYRLKVVTLRVPPLRERREDIPALVDSFVADFNRRTGGTLRGVAPKALARMMAYDWPGNVRELRNAVEGAAVLSVGPVIDLDAFEESLPRLAPSGRAPPPSPREPARAERDAGVVVPPGSTLAEAERRVILAELARAPTRARAARALGIGLRTLYTKLREYGAVDGDSADSAAPPPRRRG
jgi:DNA-binding NtrC family response regulator